MSVSGQMLPRFVDRNECPGDPYWQDRDPKVTGAGFVEFSQAINAGSR